MTCPPEWLAAIAKVSHAIPDEKIPPVLTRLDAPRPDGGEQGSTSFFNRFQVVLQSAINLLPVFPVMNLFMAVWADASHPARMVRPTIGNTARVVGFKIRPTIHSAERCRFTTCLAYSIRSGQDIFSYGSAAFVIEPTCLTGWPVARRTNGIQRPPTQLCKRHGRFRIRYRRFGLLHRLGQQVKHDDLSVISRCVRSPAMLPTDAIELAQVATAFTVAGRLEKVQVPAVRSMVTDCKIASNELHVSGLALASVEENPVVVPAVPITVLLAAWTRKKEYAWALS